VGKLESRGRVIRGSGDGSPSGVQGQSPWWGLGKAPETGVCMGQSPGAEQVLMIIKTFWAEIF